MTKGELIQFLLPFDDDLRIVAQLASGEYVDLDAIAYLIDRDGEGFGVMCEGATLHWLRPRSAPETAVGCTNNGKCRWLADAINKCQYCRSQRG